MVKKRNKLVDGYKVKEHCLKNINENNLTMFKPINPWVIASIILGAFIFCCICCVYYQEQLTKNNYVISKLLIDNAIEKALIDKTPAIVCPIKENSSICFNIVPAEVVLKWKLNQG